MENKWDKKVKKISEYIYEIPKEGKMNVPVRIFASERILEKIKQDKSIEQGINVATLPGIYGQSIMMPDAHQGYGFPIGGVAAFDVEKGIISPGGVGFDINCISGNSEILFDHGYRKKIKDMEKGLLSNRVRCINFKSKASDSSKTINFMKFKPKNKVFKIKLLSNKEIIATEDHPIYTQKGMVEVKNLKQNSEFIATYPFEGINYQNPKNKVILTEKDILNSNINFKKEEIVKELKKRKVLDLNLNDPRLPYLIKILAFNIGDGTIPKNQKYASFYGKPEDLELIREDVKKVGFRPSKIYSRTRKHEIESRRGVVKFENVEYHFKVVSRSFVTLMQILGAPIGKKTNQEYLVPKWIMEGPLWHKRLFLASLFGAEMNTPSTLTNHGYNFYMPTFSINKNEKYLENGKKFLEQIKSLLKDFNISSTISYQDEQDYIYKDHSINYRLKLFVSDSENGILKLYRQINFEYNLEKIRKANVAINFILLKQRIISEREEKSKIAVLMHGGGVSPSKIYNELVSENVNKRFLERSLYEGRSTSSRIAFNFPTFEEFLEKSTMSLGKSGMVWDKIESIEEIDFNDYVYDLTVKDENHNFIANNLVVSNCGVRLLTSNLNKDNVEPKIKELIEELFIHIPCGVGKDSNLRLSDEDYEKVLNTGVKWAVENKYATKEDLDRCEECGCMKTADSSKVSPRARKRGRKQLGTLGAGNHFIEVQYVDEIYDEKIAKVFGITGKNQIVLMIHSGSRGLGHQVCSDYLRRMENELPELVKGLPDKDLIYAPTGSELANDYLGGMSAAANYGWCNRQILSYQARKAFDKVFGKVKLDLVYDVAHNVAKIEEYKIDGKMRKVYVHRKGATRAFGPGHKELPAVYQKTGQPIILPGSMGTASYLLVGTDKAMNETFSSTAHGAGRLMSRHEAMKKFDSDKTVKDLEKKKIYIKAASTRGISEEAPGVYKDIEDVAEVSDKVGIGKKVCKLKPLGVIKG